MDREVRYKISGIIFYVFFMAILIMTKEGIAICKGILEYLGNETVRPAIGEEYLKVLGLVVASGIISIFSSISIGYLFTTIAFSFWNFSPYFFKNFKRNFKVSTLGKPILPILKAIVKRFKMIGYNYALEWEPFENSLKREFKTLYITSQDKNRRKKIEKDFERIYGTFSEDVFLSYFWQRAPTSIVGWVNRRHTAFFLGQNAFFSIASAAILSGFSVIIFKLHFSICNYLFFGFIIFLLVIIHFHSQAAGVEAQDMLRLWLAREFDKKAGSVLKKLEKGLIDEKSGFKENEKQSK